MEIQGPIKIGVLDNPETTGWELHLDFTDEFKKLDLTQQGQVFQGYISELAQEVTSRDEADRNRAGMLIVQQICEQLLPYIQAGEMALEETIMVEIAQSQAISLTALLNG